MQLKGPKTGQVYPTCPRCAKRFVVMFDRNGGEPIVAPENESSQTSRTRQPTPIAPIPVTAAPSTPSSRQTMRPEAVKPSAADADSFAMRDSTPMVYQQSTGRAPATTQTLRTSVLGGYELRRRLGQGGMGTVYLARQISLDRDVAVKVLNSSLASDARFVARFVREAYAAAQLVHHNVVQIHDIGEDQQNHFFSMEYVKGQSLADLIRTEGAITPDTAAGYILQAARGLKLAHDRGMIHRDIKPDNLLLSSDGIVKVADLGLVKRAGDAPDAPRTRQTTATDSASAGATMARTSMGTPAYMAPEQAADASSVDTRADIYSLGCTLFALLTGRPPFEGQTADEVLAAAARSEVPSPLRYSPNIPSELGRICRKMTAKKRDTRYANISLVIRDLENYLGVETAGDFTPRSQHIQELERCVKAYNDSNLATIRKVIYLGTGFLSLVLVSSLAWGGLWWWVAGGIGMVGCTFFFYQLLVELSGQRHFLSRVHQVIKTATWQQWARIIVAILLLGLSIIAMEIVLVSLAILVMSFVLAATARLTVDRMVTRQRHGAFAQAEAMLRGFRVQGLDEEALRRFVCEYSGHYWEEFYEEMFGYDAKIEARKRWGRTIRGHLRPKFASWRDPIVQWINKKIETQQMEKERKFLLNAQIKGLCAEGMDELSAGKQAKHMVEVMVAQAAEIRDEAMRYREDPASAVPADPAKLQAVQREREVFNFSAEPERVPFQHRSYFERRYGGPFDWLLGPQLRFALAALLLIGFLTWQVTNRTAAENQASQILGARIDPALQDITQAIETQHTMEQKQVVYTPLSKTLPWAPETLCDAAGSWNGGAAGVVLLISSFVPGTVIVVPIYIAALIMLFGHQTFLIKGLPIGDPPTVSLLMGLSLALLTFVFSRRPA